MNDKIYSVAAQKATRPSIDIIVERFITDDKLKRGLYGVLALLREANVKLSWFHTSHYKAKYKGEPIVSIKIGHGFKFIDNWLTIESERDKRLFDTNSQNVSQNHFEIVEEFIHTRIKEIDHKNGKYENSSNKALKSRAAIALSETLTDENKNNALRFITYLSNNNLTPQHMSPNAWKVKRGKTTIFRIRLYANKPRWVVELMPNLFGKPTPYSPTKFDVYIEEIALNDFIKSNYKLCKYCNSKCARKELDGEFNEICSVRFENPNIETINNLIKITEFWK